jgi:hypothetical protein
LAFLWWRQGLARKSGQPLDLWAGHVVTFMFLRHVFPRKRKIALSHLLKLSICSPGRGGFVPGAPEFDPLTAGPGTGPVELQDADDE